MHTKKLIIFYPAFAKGGITRNLENIIEFFSKKNIKIFLFSHNAKNKIKYKNVKIIEKNYKLFLKKKNFNIIFSSVISLYKFLKLNKEIKVIFSMQNHLPAIILALIFKKKIIIRNSEEVFGATKYADHKLSAYFILFLKLIFYNFADLVIAISLKSKLSLQKLKIKEKKIKLIYNPYLKKILKKKNKHYLYGNVFNILSVGRLTKQKNFSGLIDVVSILQKKYPFINLTIVGSGPDYNFLKFKIKSKKNISIIKWKKNLNKYYEKSHLFILNSFYEGLPNILLEAINYNVPCVATNCSGARDILLGNKGGFLVPVNDQRALEQKIEFVVKKYQKAIKKTLIAKKNIARFDQKNCRTYYSEIKKFL